MAQGIQRRDVRLEPEQQSEIAQFAKRLEGAGLALEGSTLGGAAMPASLAHVVREVLNGIAAGQAVSIAALAEELTSTVAADVLGVSRPTLMKYVSQGRIESHKVGSHHRFKSAAVLRFRRELQEEQRQAVWDLLEADLNSDA